MQILRDPIRHPRTEFEQPEGSRATKLRRLNQDLEHTNALNNITKVIENMSKAYAAQSIAMQNATNDALFTRRGHAKDSLSQEYFKLREEQALSELWNHVANLKREKHSLLELRKHVPISKREIPSPTPIPPMITLGNDDDDDEEEGRRRRRSHVLGVINTNLRFHFMICCFLGTIYISHTMMMIMIFFN